MIIEENRKDKQRNKLAITDHKYGEREASFTVILFLQRVEDILIPPTRIPFMNR